MSTRVYDAIVVGAGIVGIACAKELADAGMRVAVCEQHEYVGGGATAAGMGHIAVMDDSEARFQLTRYSQKLWHELSDELPVTAEYLPCGSMWVAADEEEMDEVRRKFRFYAERGVPVEVLDRRQLAEAEPNLRAGMAGALLMPADGVCYPPCVARYLARRFKEKGGEILFRSPVGSISDAGVTTKDGQFLPAGVMVCATGAAVTKVFPQVAVHPRKGHLLITDRYPGFLRHQLIELGYLKSPHASAADSVAFNAQPRLTGQILVGSSRQYKTEDPAVEQHMLANMLVRAVDYMPALKHLSAIRTWTGFRAATPDKLPFIGLCAGYEKVYLATGHEGLGISTSLATACLIVDALQGRPSAIDRAPYDPGRSLPTMRKEPLN